MFVGHVAAAFVGKRIEPKLSLGTLVLATMLPDILWPIFSVAGGAPKPEEVIGSLVLFVILVAWAYWMNSARPARS